MVDPSTRARRATSADRRALSTSDIDELLDIQREKITDRPYDPEFWKILFSEIRASGSRSHERLVAWRVRRDFKWLRKQGWKPNGEGPLWLQVQEDLRAGALKVTPAWARRLDQGCEMLAVLARYNLNLAKLMS